MWDSYDNWLSAHKYTVVRKSRIVKMMSRELKRKKSGGNWCEKSWRGHLNPFNALTRFELTINDFLELSPYICIGSHSHFF